MNTKAVKSFGLALMLAAGVLAVLLALGTFSPQKTAAQVSETIAVTVQPSTAAGGAATPLRVNFGAGSDGIISGQNITVTLVSFGVPDSIDPAHVAIKSGGATGKPTSVTTDPKKGTITVELGNDADGLPMDIDLSTDAAHSITFAKAAGITAPTASGNYPVSVTAGGGTGATAGAATETPADDEGFEVERSLTISPKDGDKDTVITVSGTGYGDGNVNIYVEDSDAQVPTGDPVAKAEATDGSFSVDIDVGDNLTSATNTTNNFDSGDTNWIHAVDPRTFDTPADGIDTKQFDLTGKVVVDVGTTLILGVEDVEVTLSEGNPATATLDTVTIGGENVPFGTASTTAEARATSFGDGTNPQGATAGDETLALVGGGITIKIDVPNTFTAADDGKLVLADGDNTLGSVAVVVKAIDLTLSPDAAVQGNTVSVSGSGFGAGTVDELLVGGEEVTSAIGKVAVAGSYLFTFQVPDAAPGDEVVVKLTQNDGKIGQGKITISTPTIEIDPAESRVGDTITVTGTGFPANDQVIITYGAPKDSPDVARLVDRRITDGAGGFNASFAVPGNAVTGSTGNNVQAFRPELGTNDERPSNVVTHNVPSPSVTIEPQEGLADEIVTVTGLAHRANASVEIRIGTELVSDSGARADSQGDFTIEVAIPDNQGSFPVLELKVDGEVPAGGTAIIAVKEAPPVEPTRDVATEFADLIEAEVLDSVFRYNDDKSWSGYSPAAPAEANDLDTVNSGDILWIKVSADGESYAGRELTTEPNPWNLVVAP